MINVDHENVNSDTVGTTALLSRRMRIPSATSCRTSMSVSLPPVIAVGGYLGRVGIAISFITEERLWHRGQITARTNAADFLYAWSMTRDGRGLASRVSRDCPLR